MDHQAICGQSREMEIYIPCLKTGLHHLPLRHLQIGLPASIRQWHRKLSQDQFAFLKLPSFLTPHRRDTI